MPTILKTKNSVTTTVVPTTLQQGELAVNITDKKMWVGNAATTPVQLLGDGGSGSFTTVNTTNLEVTNIKAKDGTASASIANSTGIFTHSTATVFTAGTVSLPAITTTGDTNTGIYFPAADTIAFTEGGAESMRIDSSGNVGIGTSSPSFPLDVAGAIRGNSWIGRTNTSAPSTDAFIYRPADNTLGLGTASTERMRVDSSGQVGVGVTPQTWSTGKAVEVGGNGCGVWGLASGTTYLTGAYYFNSTDKFGITGTYALISQLVPADGSFRWASSTATGTAGNNATMSERMRIDSSGNVLVGTTSAYSKFCVTTTNGNLGIAGGNTSGGNKVQSFGTTTTSNGYLAFEGYDREYMRITSGGELLLGSSSLDANAGGARFQLTQNNANWIHFITNTASSGTVWGQYILYANQAPNNTTSNFFFCADNAALRATFRSNGGLANYSGNDVNLSDAREKTNVELAGSYLDKICAIPVKTFNYIDQNREDDDGLTLGVIAQDVQAVAPELVMESNWAAKDEPEKMRLSIYQTDLQYALMKSIQELKAELDSVKAELQTLKGN